MVDGSILRHGQIRCALTKPLGSWKRPKFIFGADYPKSMSAQS
jgi:hypothetical protein